MTAPLRHLASLIAVAGLLALAGCGGDGTETTPPETPGGPLVEFHKAGGIAFTDQSLTIQPDGEANLEGTNLKSAGFRLTAEELSDLQAVLDEHPADELEPPPTDTGCADCYVYELSYGGGEYSADDASISAEAKEVTGALAEIIAEHGPPPSGY